jgi:hypothetical protein
LLGPLAESHLQEEFRTAAHGLIAWAVAVLATLTVVTLAGLTFASTGAMTAAMYGAATSKSFDAGPSAYLVDVLLRPGQSKSGRTLARAELDAGAQVEAGRILDAGMVHGEQLGAGDRTRLIDIVSDQANISRDEATARIDKMQADVQAKTRKAEDVARKVASYASLWIAFSLLFGAVVSMVAAVTARNEDERETASGAR